MKTALVACEESGVWSAELVRRGFDVLQVDLSLPPGGVQVCERWRQVGDDVRPYLVGRFDVVLAFPPCCDLSAVGAHLWPSKDVYPSLAFLAECAVAVFRAPQGLLENPQGLAARVLGAPSITCDPWEFASDPSENLNKRTCLWLNRWSLPLPVWAESMSRKSFIERVPKNAKRKAVRSRSWRGMASAFCGSLSW